MGKTVQRKCLLFSLSLLLTLGMCLSLPYRAEASGQDNEYPQEKSTISIPGFESLLMAAGQKEQSVYLYNPQENTCFFRISLAVEKDNKMEPDAAGAEEAIEDSTEISTEGSFETATEEAVEGSSEMVPESAPEDSSKEGQPAQEEDAKPGAEPEQMTEEESQEGQEAQEKEAGPASPTVIWTSDLLEPGDMITDITLTEELAKGEYPAFLLYECFSLRDQTPLNGANINLTLEVY